MEPSLTTLGPRSMIGVSVALVATLAPAANALADEVGPQIEHAPVATAIAGMPLVLRARIVDADGIFAPAVYYRARGAATYASVPMKPIGPRYEARLPEAAVAGTIEYFIEAFDNLGNGPSRRGTPDAPLIIETRAQPAVTRPLSGAAGPAVVAPPPPRVDDDEDDGGVLGAWWFWTLIGVAAAGSITAVAVVTSQNGGGPVDEVAVEIRGPDPTGGLP